MCVSRRVKKSILAVSIQSVEKCASSIAPCCDVTRGAMLLPDE